MTAAALTLIWSSGSLAAENPTPLELLQEQETVLGELESAQGALHPDLVTPLQAMVDLLREQSEFERAAELQEQMLEVMQANAGEQSPDWIPSLKEMVAGRANSGATDGVDDLLRGLRILNAAQHDYPELIRTIELEAHWLMTEGAGTTGEQRVKSFLRAQQVLANQYALLIGEFFDKNDPMIIPWMYHATLNNYQLGEMIMFLCAFDDYSRRRLEAQIPGVYYYTVKLGNLDWIRDIGEHYSAVDDLEGQAMAKIYEADFVLRASRSEAFELYENARELLREAGVPEERIGLYFSRPQLIPTSRFYPTLEEAIGKQEADIAAWSPEQQGAAHVGTFRAWNESVPAVAMPVSDHVFWDSSSNYYQVIVELNISSAGRVSAVGVIDMEPEDEEFQRYVRRAVLSKRFRPAMVEGRGQSLRDVQMRVLIPRTEG